MQNLINAINKNFIPKITHFINLKSVLAMKGGMFYTIPLMIIGSVLLILANITGYGVFQDIIKDASMQGYYATFSIASLITTIGVSYTYAKNENYEPMMVSVTALSLFILLNDYKLMNDETSATNIISAIIVGLIVAKSYIRIANKTDNIKEIKYIPSGVVVSICKFIPLATILSIGLLVFSVFEFYFNTTPFHFVYDFIQLPIQNMSDSFLFAIIIAIIVPFLWFFGIHGLAIVETLIMPILIANTNGNAIIVEQGIELTIENGAYIVTNQFLYLFVNLSGAGITIGIAIYLYFFAKSENFKELGKLAIVPAMFNINEPILFGVPIVLNKFMFIPFLSMSIISATTLYLGQYFGVIPLFKPIMLHWTTPPILSGLIMGGWKLALLQFINIVMSFLIYFPFMKNLDRRQSEKIN